MKLKNNLSKDFLEQCAGVIENEGFGYMLLYGGLEPCNPEKLLENEEDIKKVNEAIKIIREYERLLPSIDDF